MARPRMLVIDTSVMRSAGEGDARAKACRNTLDIVRRSDKLALLSPTLLGEWREHLAETAYGRKWFVKMDEMRRVDSDAPDQHNATLHAARQSFADRPNEIRAVEKDVHLVAAALSEGASGQVVISCDTTMEELLSRLLEGVPALKGLHWVDPERSGVVDWVKSCCPDQPEYQLGAYPSKP